MSFLRSKFFCFTAFIVAIAIFDYVPSLSQAYPPQGRTLQFLGRYSTGLFNQSAAEIVSYDPATKTAYMISSVAVRLDAINLSNPKNPTLSFTIDLSPYGSAVNSVAVKNGIIAAAMEAPVRTDNGSIVLLTTSGQLLTQLAVGAQPDMVTFTHDGNKILVANEGEPSSNYSVDPNGSISIVNIAAGVQNVTVTTLDFSSYNNRRQELLGKGIRLFGPNATVAQDFEPEYVAVSPDNSRAWVTLQENNAVAVINLTNNTLADIYPLGTKDWGRGLPRCEKYTMENRPLMGTTAAGQDILLGGFSGLWYEGTTPDGKMKFITHPDRGPNAEPANIGGVVKRPFALPDYQARIVRFELDPATKSTTITEQIPLFRTDGVTPISGKPNVQAQAQGLAYTDEFGVDLFGNPISNDEMGGDMEGIVVAPDGTFYLVDEYRPAIYNFDQNGIMIDRFIPMGTAAAASRPDGTFGTEVLPAVYGQRRNNRGFEAVAIEGNKLYAFIQSGIDSPDLTNDNTSRNSNFLRIVEFDIVTKTVTGEFVYPIFERAQTCDKLGDAVSLGNGRFLVVERDDATGPNARKYIFEINLTGATNTFTNPPSLAVGKTIENSTYDELVAANVRPVFKRKAVHLASIGYDQAEKVEGLARIDDNTFAIINDNDFGVGGSVLPAIPNGTITVNSTPIELGIISFDRSNALDASDRDGAGNTASINFRNWQNLYGLFMPDAISSFTSGGRTYYITANEGDARDYSGFGEERRVSDATRVPLNPVFFPNATTLRQDANLGRLQITSFVNTGTLSASSMSSGDLDGNGTFEMLHTFGTRSFTIWNADGNLVWDSGDDLERRTAFLFPNNFNASNSNNTRDGRSTSKGPEPEAVTVGVVNGRTLAFIGLERIGGIAVWDITEAHKPKYVDYINTRSFNALFNYPTEGDLGPEGLVFIPENESPNGLPMILCANETSGTVSIYQVNPTAVYVDGQNGDDNNTGINRTNSPIGTGPKKTVQGGISGVANEGRVEVTAGMYNETVTINKQATVIGPAMMNSQSVVTINGGNGTTVTSIGSDNKLFQRINLGIAANPVARIASIPTGSSGNVVLIGNAQIGGSNVSASIAASVINDANDAGFGTGRVLFGPMAPPTQNLVLHLDATSHTAPNNSPTALWNDRSGNDNNAEQTINARTPMFLANSPLFNNRNSMVFTGGKGMEVKNSAVLNGGGHKTMFVVFRTGSSIAGYQTIAELGGTNSGFSMYVFNGRIYFGTWDNSILYSSRIISANTNYLAQFTYNGERIGWSLNRFTYSSPFNDNSIAPDFSKVGIGAVSEGTRYHNRVEGSAFAHPFAGQIPEVLVYNASHIDMRELTFAYLNEKYNLNLALQPLEKTSDSDTEWEIIEGEGNNNTGENASISIQPNPANDNTTIIVNNANSSDIRLTVTDLFGTTVIPTRVLHSLNNNVLTLDTKQLSSGMYIVRVESNGSVFSEKMTVVR